MLRRQKMTPFSFEWKWISDYFIFMGLLYLALTIIASGIVYCLVKTWLDLGEKEGGHPAEEIPHRTRYHEY